MYDLNWNKFIRDKQKPGVRLLSWLFLIVCIDHRHIWKIILNGPCKSAFAGFVSKLRILFVLLSMFYTLSVFIFFVYTETVEKKKIT